MVFKFVNVLVCLNILCSFALANDPIKVAILDTGLDLSDPRFTNVLCPAGHKDFTGEGLMDYNGHGTHVAGLIKQYASDSKYCIVILKIFKQTINKNIIDLEGLAIAHALSLNVSIINFSGGGEEYSYKEYMIFKKAKSIHFVIAAGNEHANLDVVCDYFPACYASRLPNILIVGNLKSVGRPSPTSNYGRIVGHWEIGDNVSSTLPDGETGIMSGTSMSCAITTGKLIKQGPFND